MVKVAPSTPVIVTTMPGGRVIDSPSLRKLGFSTGLEKTLVAGLDTLAVSGKDANWCRVAKNIHGDGWVDVVAVSDEAGSSHQCGNEQKLSKHFEE